MDNIDFIRFFKISILEVGLNEKEKELLERLYLIEQQWNYKAYQKMCQGSGNSPTFNKLSLNVLFVEIILISNALLGAENSFTEPLQQTSGEMQKLGEEDKDSQGMIYSFVNLKNIIIPNSQDFSLLEAVKRLRPEVLGYPFNIVKETIVNNSYPTNFIVSERELIFKEDRVINTANVYHEEPGHTFKKMALRFYCKS